MGMHNEAWTAHGADLDCKIWRALMKAIVLTCDRYRAVTEHMILQYEKLWPDHPFVFRVPYQNLTGTPGNRAEYVQTPAEIRATVFQTLAGLDDEEWIYWCPDDKYPIELVVDKIVDLVSDIAHSAEASGLLFCRCKALLRRPEATLHPQPKINSFGDVYLERKGWHQIWIHQFLRVKVLRFLFSQMPERIASAKLMDALKDQVPKLAEHRLFVTRENFAIFGESTHKGTINRNCYESIKRTKIELPKWFQKPNDKYVTLGKLEGQSITTQSR